MFGDSASHEGVASGFALARRQRRSGHAGKGARAEQLRQPPSGGGSIMSWNTFRKLVGDLAGAKRLKTRHGQRPAAWWRPAIEALEDRLVPALLIVNSLADA